ncbi:MAG: hypothetical protein AAGA15_00145 [Pseudomonadota bacterium]
MHAFSEQIGKIVDQRIDQTWITSMLTPKKPGNNGRRMTDAKKGCSVTSLAARAAYKGQRR